MSLGVSVAPCSSSLRGRSDVLLAWDFCYGLDFGSTVGVAVPRGSLFPVMLTAALFLFVGILVRLPYRPAISLSFKVLGSISR